ncbi:MAG: hypothetical protein V7L23_18650 [Nostoc sp.]|uniref:hypothetical protein n=1 Tax=Nostoc sp. TaxID=1180 RepID=UPI002FF1E897
MENNLCFVSGNVYKALVDKKLGITIELLFCCMRISVLRAALLEFKKPDGTLIQMRIDEAVAYFGVEAK